MLRTVLWHHDHAVPGYVELSVRSGSWERAAAEYQKRERLLLESAAGFDGTPARAPRRRESEAELDDRRRQSSRIQRRQSRIHGSERLDALSHRCAECGGAGCREFVDRLGQLQRGALAHTLRSPDLTGATIAFSSMARWNVVAPCSSAAAVHLVHRRPRRGPRRRGGARRHLRPPRADRPRRARRASRANDAGGTGMTDTRCSTLTPRATTSARKSSTSRRDSGHGNRRSATTT